MNLNESNIRKIQGLVVFTVLLLVIAQNLGFFVGFLLTIFKLISPFLLGACIAFILNIPMRFLERLLFTNRSYKDNKIIQKIKRPISVILALLLVCFILFIVIFIVFPQLGQTIATLGNNIPAFINRVTEWAKDLFEKNPLIVAQIESLLGNWQEFDWQSMISKVFQFLQSGAGNILNSTISVALNIVNGLTTFCVGFVFSIYVLMQKEKLSRQIKLVLKAFFPEKVCNRIFEIAALTNITFSSFISGQCIEALILGTMFFITLSVLNFPYSLLVGVLIAFTALIPIFGAFIGCVIATLLILMVNPIQALWFIVIFNILQQIEGNFIYPHVVGNSVGLPSIWVLVAVTLGGSIFGVLGMLVFIPLTSVFYSLFRQYVLRRTEKRKGMVVPIPKDPVPIEETATEETTDSES